MKLLRRLPLLFLISLLFISVFFISQVAAQEKTDDEKEQEVTLPLEGIDISNDPFNEFFYWDVRGGKDVIIGKGGFFTKEVVLAKDSTQAMGDSLETYTVMEDLSSEAGKIMGWLPVLLKEAEFNKGDQQGCGIKQQIPLRSGEGKARSDYTFNINTYGETAYIDLIGDGKDGLINRTDNFTFSWYVITPKGSDEWLASVPYDIAATSTDKVATFKEYIAANEKDVPEEIEYTKCEFSYKDSFNTSISRYNPESLDNASIAGKLLGKKGMEFKEWVRRTDNIREYLAIEKSAREVTLQHCGADNFTDNNLCHTTLSKDFHKCYLRAIGYNPSKTSEYVFEDVEEFERFKINSYFQKKWMHSIRANTDTFVSCFSLGAGAKSAIDVNLKSSTSPSFFESNSQSEQFANRIVNGTLWPSSINPLGDDDSDETNTAAQTTCSLGKMGWILCPVMQFLSKIADNLFKFLEGWMQIPPLKGDHEGSAFRAWTYLRDFGNILFTILFLGIILIQLTGGTLTGYTIRKKAPHIAITALLINISFILCSAAVDASNIIGSSVVDIANSFSHRTTPIDGFKTWEAITTSVAFAGGAAAGTVAVVTSMAALIPMLITTVFSMVIILVLLLMRQALVIILVVIAPIALAARLLPGTEQWFKRWKSLFTQMIFLYPAIALVFGGAHFASTIIVASATEQGGLNGALLAIFGLAIQVIPLFIAPIVLKFGGTALNSVNGTLRSKLSGVEKATSQAATSTAENISNRMDIRAAQGGILGINRRRKMRGRAKKEFLKREINRSQLSGVADTKTGQFVASASGGGVSGLRRDKIKAALAAEAEKLSKENIRAAKLRIEDDSIIKNAATAEEATIKQVARALNPSVDSSERIAHMQSIVEKGDVHAIDTLIDGLDTMSTEQRHELAKVVGKSNVKNQAAHLSDTTTTTAIADGTATVDNLHQSAFQRGDYSKLSTASQQNAQAMESMSSHLTPAQITEFKETYATAARDSNYSQNMAKSAIDKEKTL